MSQCDGNTAIYGTRDVIASDLWAQTFVTRIFPPELFFRCASISWKVYAGYPSPIFWWDILSLSTYLMWDYNFTTLKPYHLTTFQPFNFTILQPNNLTTVQPYSYNLTTLQPYNHTTLQTYNLITLQPYSLATLQPYNLTTWQPDNHTTLQKTKRQKDILAQVRVFIWHWRWILNQIFIYFVATSHSYLSIAQ